jgi:phosphoglycerate dehydrogenase-like enzyme
LTRVAILDDYQGLARTLADWESISDRATVTIFDRNLSVSEAKEALRDFDVVCLMRERMAFPADLIEALPKLKFIAITGRQNRTLDVAAATRRGIAISYTAAGGVGSWTTAELAWGLILASARNIPAEDAALREGAWQTTAGITLNGRTLGIAGLGKIGRQIAGYAKAFGMDVQAWSPNLTEERAAAAGVRLADKHTLFATSDVISLHLVLGEGTRNVVGPDELAAMQKGAILVNTARAGLVDQEALIAALKGGRIRAGIDVYPQEPLAADSMYRSLPNAVVTPHLGYVTEETMRDFHEGTLEVVRAFLDGTPIRLVA